MKFKYTKAIIILNGDTSDIEMIKRFIDDRTYIIGCDGGTEHIRTLNLTPHTVIGDFDSVTNSTLHYYRQHADSIEFIDYPSDKDCTDSELAIDYAVSKGFHEIIVFGTLGTRIDHMLGNMFLLSKRKYSKINLKIVEANQLVYVIRETAVIEGTRGDTISLMPLRGSAAIEKSSGLQYDLSKYEISQEQNHGISNVMTNDTAHIVIKRGLLLVVHQKRKVESR
jgi:thiamine pyrophosphokinase